MILTSSMAWTQQDLDQVKAAVIALATGQRVVTVTWAGPPAREVSYGTAQLGELRALQAEIQRDVSGAPRFRRFGFSKGFDTRNDGGDSNG